MRQFEINLTTSGLSELSLPACMVGNITATSEIYADLLFIKNY